MLSHICFKPIIPFLFLISYIYSAHFLLFGNFFLKYSKKRWKNLYYFDLSISFYVKILSFYTLISAVNPSTSLFSSRIGLITSATNSSVCCGARPTKFSGFMIDCNCSIFIPNAGSAAILSNDHLVFLLL